MSTLPKNNLHGYEIRNTLNRGGGRTDNVHGSKYRKTASINIWSFYKPYNFDSIESPTDDEIKAMNCGLTPFNVSSYMLLPDIMDGEMNGWEYNKPIGGEHSPFRSGDYRGYYADAKPMIQDFYLPDRASNQFEGNSISASAIVTQQDGKSVSLSDLGVLKDYYPAVYIKQVNGSQYRRYTGLTTLSSGVFNVDIQVDDLQSGEWIVYPFLAENQIPENYDVDNRYYTIPNVKERKLSIVTSYFVIGVMAERKKDGTRTVEYTIRINNSMSAQTWTNNTWRLRFFGNEFSDPMTVGEMSGTFDSPLNVNGNGETIISGVIENINPTMWNQLSMILWVSFNSGAHVSSASIVENTRE